MNHYRILFKCSKVKQLIKKNLLWKSDFSFCRNFFELIKVLQQNPNTAMEEERFKYDTKCDTK